MNKKEIFAKIGIIVTEVNDQYNYLNQHPDHLNELELELFAANSSFLKDHIDILRKLSVTEGAASQQAIAPEAKTASQPMPAEPEKNEPEAEQETAKAEESGPAAEGPAVAENTAANAPNTIEEDVPAAAEEKETPVTDGSELAQSEESKPEEPAPVTEPTQEEPAAEGSHAVEQTTEPEKHHEAKSVQQPEEIEEEKENAQEDELKTEETPKEPVTPGTTETESSDAVVHEVVISERTIAIDNTQEPAHVPTVNELISAQLNKSSLGGQFTQQPVNDLKSIISLNDKLLFIKDLFNGYSLAYSEAIELVNRYDSLDAATGFLQANYATKNNWASKQSTADHFFEILGRRFA